MIHTYIHAFILALLALVSIEQNYSQTFTLTAKDGPWYNALVFAIASGNNGTNDVVYIGTGAGIFKTTNNGTTYTVLNSGHCSAIACELTNPDNVYFNIYDIYNYTNANTLYHSTDGGQNTEVVMDGLDDRNQPILSLSICPQDNTKLLLGYKRVGNLPSLYITEDSGQNWSDITYDAGASVQNDIVDICFNSDHNDIVYILAGYADNPNNTIGCGVYKSTNGGYNWTRINNDLPHCLFLSLGLESSSSSFYDYLYLGTNAIPSSGIYSSSNSGSNWAVVYGTHSYRMYPDIFVQNGTIYTGLDECFPLKGLLKTTNHGLNWTNINSGMLSVSTKSVNITPDGHIWTGGYNTIYESTDGGTNFIEKTEGIERTSLNSVASYDNLILSSGYYLNSRFYRTTNSGSLWTSILNDCGFRTSQDIDIDPNSTQVVHSVHHDADYVNLYIYKSTNSGLNWVISFSIVTEDTEASHLLNDIKIDDNNSNHILAAGMLSGATKYVRSTNGGSNYYIYDIVSVNPLFTLNTVEGDPNVTQNGKSKIWYAGGNYYSGQVRLYINENEGIENNWNLYNTGINQCNINQVTVAKIGSSLNYYTYLATSIGVYRKLSNTSTWSACNSGLDYTNAISVAVDPIQTDNIFVSVNNSGGYSYAYYSSNNGTNWSSVDQSDNNLKINRLKFGVVNPASIAPPPLYAATNKGVYEITSSSYSNSGNQKISNSVIYNYPNPFNSQTEFRISLNYDSDIRLNLYDITGRLVTQIFSGDMKKGDNKVAYNFDNLASGLYLYQLIINKADIITKKLVLIK